MENILKTGRKCFINEEIVVEKNGEFFTTNKKNDSNNNNINNNKNNNEIQISIKNIQNELNNIKKFFGVDNNNNNEKNVCRNLKFNNEIFELEEEIKMLKENKFNLLSQNIRLRNKIKYSNENNNKENINVLNNQNLITPLKDKIENHFLTSYNKLSSTFLKKKRNFENGLYLI